MENDILKTKKALPHPKSLSRREGEDQLSSHKKTLCTSPRQYETPSVNKINQNSVEWAEQKSPRGKYHLFRRFLSVALGGKRDLGTWGGGHPFELEQTRLPSGKTNFPYHSHAAQWEMYIILSGQGHARTTEGKKEIGPGDCFLSPPGDPHQIQNTGTEDLVYYVIADNPQADVTTYPDSGKWSIKPQRKNFEMTEVDYFKDEE
jgi:uncharacterized cupin superfamily protein